MSLHILRSRFQTFSSFRLTIGLAVVLSTLLSLSNVQAAGKEDPILEVIEKTSRAIVNINTSESGESGGSTGKSPGILKKFFESNSDDDDTGANIGSGVVLDSKGTIVTNEHLISKASSIRVKFMHGKEYEAHVVGSDPELDIAILKINAGEDFPYLKVRPRKPIRVGEKTIVIGNPFGLSSSVTVGVISALGRNLRIENKTYVNLIQTDASINPGSSGGALLDVQGNLLGVVTAIYGEGKGIGFAIPIEDITNMLSEFFENKTRRPLLGLFFDRKKTTRGFSLHVNNIISGSPAERYGLKEGDVITELQHRKIREGLKIQSVLRSIETDQDIVLKFSRQNKTYIIKIPANEAMKYIPLPLDELLCGLRIRGIKGYPKLKFKLKEKDGVVVTKVMKNGFGSRSGILPGDIVAAINNHDVLSEKDFNTYMIDGLKRNYILYQIKRGGDNFFIPIKLDSLL